MILTLNYINLFLRIVNLTFESISTSSKTVIYSYICSFFAGFNTDLESSTKFVPHLQGDGDDRVGELQTCLSGRGIVMFSSLHCVSEYKLTAYFTSPDDNISDCQVANMEAMVHTMTRDSYLDLNCPSTS